MNVKKLKINNKDMNKILTEEAKQALYIALIGSALLFAVCLISNGIKMIQASL